MAMALDLHSYLEPFIEIPGATSVALVRNLFQKAQGRFMIITEKGNPQALVVKEYLTESIGEQAISLVSIVKKLPPLVVVERGSTALGVEDLRILSLWLSQTKAPGLVVYQNDTVIGVVSRHTIVHALPPSAILPSSNKRGDPVVPESSYFCRKCAEQDPPAALVLSERGKVPRCPKHRFEHSTNFMEKGVNCVQHRS